MYVVRFFLLRRKPPHQIHFVTFKTNFWILRYKMLASDFTKLKGLRESTYHTGLFINHFFFFFSWLCCYMSQMNPLIGPVLNQRTLFAIKEYWVRIFRKKNQKYFESPILTDFFFLHIFRTAGRLLKPPPKPTTME